MKYNTVQKFASIKHIKKIVVINNCAIAALFLPLFSVFQKQYNLPSVFSIFHHIIEVKVFILLKKDNQNCVFLFHLHKTPFLKKKNCPLLVISSERQIFFTDLSGSVPDISFCSKKP